MRRIRLVSEGFERSRVKGRNGWFKLASITVWGWTVGAIANDPDRSDAVEVQFHSNRVGKEAPCVVIMGTDEAERLAADITKAIKVVRNNKETK